MRQILLENIDDSMVLANDICDENGRILLRAGIILNSELKKLLYKHNIVSVLIQETACNKNTIEEISDLVSTTTRANIISLLENAFKSSKGIAASLPALTSYVEEILDSLLARKYLLLNLNDIRLKSNYLFIHSVDVGLFSMVMGLAMGLAREEIVLLGISGFLHDFGKTRIDAKILNKKGPLTLQEFEHVKEHPLIGYNVLRREIQINYKILLTALQHHERFDGTGYPWGIAGEKIHLYSRIVAVADVYDALTTDRVYREKIPNYTAIKMLNEGAGTLFDPGVIRIFNSLAVPYEIGAKVALSNGLTGSVVALNTAKLHYPIVATEVGKIDLFRESCKVIKVFP